MTAEQKSQIARMRSEGVAYSDIAITIGASVSAIKTYCSRHGLSVTDATPVEIGLDNDPKAACQHCGRIFYTYTKRKYCCHPCYIAERYV